MDTQIHFSRWLEDAWYAFLRTGNDDWNFTLNRPPRTWYVASTYGGKFDVYVPNSPIEFELI